MMHWQIKSFEALSTRELFEIYKIRVAVFVVEQNCAYQEVDNEDLRALHLFACDEVSAVAAYCRIIPHETCVKIGRVLVAAEARKGGLGRVLMQRALVETAARFAGKAVRIQAQVYLQAFYESLGFVADSAVYEEDGIPHIDMILQVG